jgi:hypothetical protein
VPCRVPVCATIFSIVCPVGTLIKVYDNSAEAAADGTVPDPVLVLKMENGQVISPALDDLEALQGAPEWSKPIIEAALRAEPACD